MTTLDDLRKAVEAYEAEAKYECQCSECVELKLKARAEAALVAVRWLDDLDPLAYFGYINEYTEGMSLIARLEK